MPARKNRPPLRAKFVFRGITPEGEFVRIEKQVVFKRSRIKKADQHKRAA